MFFKSKRFPTNIMEKTMGHGNNRIKPPKPNLRRAPPKMGKLNGKDVIMCPYCDPPHPLSTQEISPCGTVLEVQAIQAIFRNQRCIVCGEISGEQTMVGNKYVHTYDCKPGHRMFATPPRKSTLATLFWRFPDWAQLLVARKFGKVVLELKNSEEKIIGYTWQRVQKVQKDAQTPLPVSGRSDPSLGS